MNNNTEFIEEIAAMPELSDAEKDILQRIAQEVKAADGTGDGWASRAALSEYVEVAKAIFDLTKSFFQPVGGRS